MSYELFNDGKPKGQVASNAGMSLLAREVASLKLDDTDELERFILRGWSSEPGLLRESIQKAIDANGPLSESSKDILAGMLKMLPEKGTVSVSCE